jgi:hypothetical protein
MSSSSAQVIQDSEIVVTEVNNTNSKPKMNSRDDIPSEVKPAENNGLPRGVEEQALKLARLFMGSQGQLARKCFRRGELSHLYVSTFATWAPEDSKNDQSLQRPFKQILFALAHGMKLVRVVNGGRQLLWNRYRDNTGAQIESRQEDRRQEDRRPHDYRDDRRPRNSRPRRNNGRHNGRRNDRRQRHHDDRRDGDWEVQGRREAGGRRSDRRSRSPSTDRYEVREDHNRGSSSKSTDMEYDR